MQRNAIVPARSDAAWHTSLHQIGAVQIRAEAPSLRLEDDGHALRRRAQSPITPPDYW